METIKNYIFEKLKLNKDLKIPEPPMEVDINKFSLWLKYDFKFTNDCINDLKMHIKKEWHLDDDEYTLIPYQDANCGETVKKFISNFPDSKQKEMLSFQIHSKECNYIISGYKCLSTLQAIIFIQDKTTQKALYAYIINIQAPLF